MRDTCPKCNGALLLLENSRTIYCMDCAWLISVEHWNEWNTLKEMLLWVIGLYVVSTNALDAGKFTWQTHQQTNALIVMRGEDDALRIIREIQEII